MSGVQARIYVAVALVSVAVAFSATAAPARANAICSGVSLWNGAAGKLCSLASHGGPVINAAKKLFGGDPIGAGKALLGQGGSKASAVATPLALAAIVAWVAGGAGFVLHATSTVIGHTTAPQLTSTWFSATYWRVAGIAAILTLPFLFAAAIQSIVQSDITLLIRAALGYLPVALLAIAIAAPMTMLLLSASDQLAAIVSSAAGHQSLHFLRFEGALVGTLAAAVSPFLVFFVALLTVGAALALWMELLMRAAAVYVIVLLLPLAFAAFVWPARRIWVVRAVELLLALIFSKFVIVAVLALGGTALSQGAHHWSLVGVMAGLVLLVLAASAPWALLRLLPVTEIASAAAGSLRGHGRGAVGGADRADAWTSYAEDWASKAAQMKRDAEGSKPNGGGADAAREGLADGDGGASEEEGVGYVTAAASGAGDRASTGASDGASGGGAGAASADGDGGSAGGSAGDGGTGSASGEDVAGADPGTAAADADTGFSAAGADTTGAAAAAAASGEGRLTGDLANTPHLTDEQAGVVLGRDDLPAGRIHGKGGSSQPNGDASHLDESDPTPPPQDPEGGWL